MSDLKIKSWAEEDRPREKMLLKGREALSNAELLAIILGSGSRQESAVALAKRMLSDIDDLDAFGRMSLDQLTNYNGVGNAKAISIVAALELGRRRQTVPSGKRTKISSSAEAYRILGPQLSDLPYETFWALYLNNHGRFIAKEKISSGGMTSTIVDPQFIFEFALRHRASKIILFHNHPSGEVNPSHQDVALTQKLKEAGKLMSISVVDHLIIGHGQYYSFSDGMVCEVEG